MSYKQLPGLLRKIFEYMYWSTRLVAVSSSAFGDFIELMRKVVV